MELLQKLEVNKMIGVLYQFDQSFCFLFITIQTPLLFKSYHWLAVLESVFHLLHELLGNVEDHGNFSKEHKMDSKNPLLFYF